ncbi:MAG: hypothetical protein ORN49_13120 [Rhodobacteraceae bacterium]|nr:hypothetical protein [Paracoccaceae bacterium]
MVSLKCAAAIAAFVGCAAPAQAGIPYGYQEFLDYVADLPTGDAEIAGFLASRVGPSPALCHLITKYHIMFIPIFYRSEVYALGENRCDTNKFYRLEGDALAQVKALEIFPADLPDAPSLGFARRLPPVLWAGLITMLSWASYRRTARKRSRYRLMGPISDTAKSLIDIICHAARFKPQVTEQDLEVLAALAQKVSGGSFDADRIRSLIALCSNALTPRDYKALIAGLSRERREMAMRLALSVLQTSGPLSDEQINFLGGLAAEAG